MNAFCTKMWLNIFHQLEPDWEYGEAIGGDIAAWLRESIIGDRSRPGVLCWLVEHVDVI